MLDGINITPDKLNRLLYTSASSEQLKFVSTEVDRLEIRDTCHGHTQWHDGSDESKRPVTYDSDKRNSANEYSFIDKLVLNSPKTMNDALIFEKLLEISMKLPSFNDKDSYNPRPI